MTAWKWTEKDQRYLDTAVNYETGWLCTKLRAALAELQRRDEDAQAADALLCDEDYLRETLAYLRRRVATPPAPAPVVIGCEPTGACEEVRRCWVHSTWPVEPAPAAEPTDREPIIGPVTLTSAYDPEDVHEVVWTLWDGEGNEIDLNDGAVLDQIAAALNAQQPTDTQRLDWLEHELFERHWDGCLNHASTWHMAGPYRHTLQKMQGSTLREAIDAARAALNAQGGTR